MLAQASCPQVNDNVSPSEIIMFRRIIYKVVEREVLVMVIDLTAHDYRRK